MFIFANFRYMLHIHSSQMPQTQHNEIISTAKSHGKALWYETCMCHRMLTTNYWKAITRLIKVVNFIHKARTLQSCAGLESGMEAAVNTVCK